MEWKDFKGKLETQAHWAGWNLTSTERKAMTKVVLIVEDDALIRMDAVDMFEAEGYVAIEAGDADAAIVLLESRDDITHLFTDIEMPGSMDGLRLAFAVRDRWPPVVVVIASGRVRPSEDKIPSRAVFIRKPYGQADVTRAVTKASA